MTRYPIDRIKDRLSCVEYASRHLGLPVQKPGDRCVSFREGANNKTSLQIDERFWFDYAFPGPEGMGLGGDVIDLCAWARHGGRLAPALRELAALTGLAPSQAASTHGTDLDALQEAAERFHAALTPEDREYLHKRGIGDETIDRLKIGRGSDWKWIHGLAGRIVIPYWVAGRVRYLVGRAQGDEEPKYKKLWRGQDPEKSYVDHPIWGVDSLSRKGSVIIAEGIMDALSVWQEGMAVLTPVTGRFSHEQEKDLVSILRGRTATVCMDYDPESHAGQAFTVALARKLYLAGIATRVKLLEGDKSKVDLNDLHSRGENIKASLAAAEGFAHWEVRRLSVCPDEAERKRALQDFLTRASRCHPWPEIAELLALAKSLRRDDEACWHPAWLSEIQKQLKAPPTDDTILEEIRRRHHLVYSQQTGWYVYSQARGVWERRQDSEIEQMISEILGPHKSGSRIQSAFRSARADFTRSEPMNARRDLLNFRNGMLNLGTLELVAHSPDFYSTIQLDYAYDPAAECPKWNDFLYDVTDGDPDRWCLLQQMFGVCLLADNRIHERGFILMGGGANGKSVLLDILTHMLGPANVSSVNLSNLNDSFQRIRLMDKLANISAETHSQVKGVEETLKQIISGDTISGSYKYRDEVEFKPYCTCIFATNSLQEAEDTSYGFQRKICFVKFPVQFVKHPSPSKPQQRQRDNRIRDQLLPELPGIVNWALEGLKTLEAAGDFVETEDHRSAMKDFMLLSNPLVAFLEDEYFAPGERHARKEVYSRYKTWCREGNTHPLSSRKFWQRMRDQAGVFEGKSGGERYVVFPEPNADERNAA